MTKEKVRPAVRELAELARSAEQKLHDVDETAKRLKAKSREAKRKLKQAKKTAKQASKAARAARKEADEARRVYEKATARAEKARTKAAKDEQPLTTPKKRATQRHPTRRRHNERVTPQSNGVDFEESFSDTDLKTLEPH